MILAFYFNIFILFSFIGWLYECLYCTIQNRHWDNRGFLYGPFCPIYGFGAIFCLFFFGHLPLYLIETGQLNLPIASNGLAAIPIWHIFLICSIGSAILEYSTSYVLEKLFHAVWWDYSHLPLNLHGRICLPASLAFGAAGVLISLFLLPPLVALPNQSHPMITVALAILLAIYLGMDLGLTIESLVELTRHLDLITENFDNRMESTVQMASQSSLAQAASSAAREASLMAREVAQTARYSLTRREKYHLHSIKFYRGRTEDDASTKSSSKAFQALQRHIRNNLRSNSRK